MAVNFCEERLQFYQEEYPFLKTIGYSMTQAKGYLSELNQKIRMEQEKNRTIKYEEKRKKRKQHSKIQKDRKRGKDKVRNELKVIDNTYLQELKLQKRILVNYMRYLKRYHQLQYQGEQETHEQPILTSRMQQLYCQALEGNFDGFKISDFYTIYCYILEQENEDQSLLINMIEKLRELYWTVSNEEKEEAITCFRKLKQKTKYYQQKLDDKSESLRTIMRETQSICEIHDIQSTPSIEKCDPLESFLKLLLSADTSYDYIEKLIYQSLPYRDLVNFKDQNGNHILFYIQQLLFQSCQIELKNQTKDYISKEYYGKIFQLFLNHPQQTLTEEEYQQLGKNQESFITELQNHHYKKGPMIQQFLYDLYTKKEKEHPVCPTTFTPYYYGQHKNLIDEYTFAFSDGQPLDKAYSIQMTEQGTFIVKIHIVDVSSSILEDSELDCYLKDKMFKDQEFIPDSIAKPYIYLQQENDKSIAVQKGRPVLTYQVEVTGKGKILNSDVYQSMVVVNRVLFYQDIRLQDIRKDEDLFPLCYLYYANASKGQSSIGYQMEEILLSYVKKIVGNYLTSSNLPMIYHVQPEQDADLYLEYMKDSSYIFGKMEKQEAHLLHGFLKEGVNYAYLGLENIGHYALNDSFCVRLFHPCSSYIDLVTQRLIKFYFTNKDQAIDTDEIKSKLEEIVVLANEKLHQIRMENRVKKLENTAK